MTEDDLKKVDKMRFSPMWDELSVTQVTGLIQLNLWLSRHLPNNAENMRLVELGSHSGESAAIFEAFPMWRYIACVDMWKQEPVYELCRRRLSGSINSGKVTMHRALSVHAASDMLYATVCAAGDPHFVYVDADHDYDSVRAHLAAWCPRLALGGLIGGHDYVHTWPGVRTAVDEFKAEHGLELTGFQDGSYVLHPPKI